MLNREQRDYLFPKAYNAALRAGAAIIELYNSGEGAGKTDLKKDCTPITEADRRAHEIIKEYLKNTHVPLLSEEGREMVYEERKGWDMFWIVDPLDGTKEFIKGNGEFTVNIALILGGKPVLSVVYVPYLSKIYMGDSIQGSFVKKNVPPATDADFGFDEIFAGALKLPLAAEVNKPLRIAVSRSHNTEETFRLVDHIRSKYSASEIIEQGSSYKFCLLAEGTVDCYVRTTHTYEWDTAAGEHILALAGGVTHSLPDEKPLEYNKESLHNPHFFCRSKFMPSI